MQGALPVFGVGGRQGACMEGSRPTAARRGAGCVPPVTQPLPSLRCWGAREGPGPHPTPPETIPTGWDTQGVPARGCTHPQTRCSPWGSMLSSSSYVAMFSPSFRTQSEKPR